MPKGIEELKPYRIKKNGVTYKIEPQYTTVVDSYGYGGSVELSHHESLGYSTITGYSGQSHILNFSFANPNDGIDIELDEEIQNITINSSNLKYAKFESSRQINFDVILNCGMFEMIEILKIFLNNNSQMVRTINFQGIDNSILKKILSNTCEKFNKNVSFRSQAKRTAIEEKNAEKEIDNMIQDLQIQLLQEKEKLEEVKSKIDKGNIKDTKETKEEIENIDANAYKKIIEELKKQIPKRLKEQFKHLSIYEIMEKYDGKINELINLLNTIENEKQGLMAQIDVIEKRKIIDDINNEIDMIINSTDSISNGVADFWWLANNTDNYRLGIIRTKKTMSSKFNGPSDVLEETICSSLLEFELSKKFGRPIPSEKLEESEFIVETSDELSLQQKNEINKRKEEINKLKKRAKKHPKQYKKPGVITLYAQKKDDSGNIIQQTEFEIEITQEKLIDLGIDPSDFDWKEMKKAKVNSEDIARASKKGNVKKSLVGQIAKFFSKQKGLIR